MLGSPTFTPRSRGWFWASNSTQAENMMAAGLADLQPLRPAFDAFYGTLTPARRKTLDAFAARHHHSREM
ncbi:MAG: hypothetical protein IH878_11935 [Gemmatimonadetes bacterium]|nr:hypothetical protein [Gemmatimonadota bacterium]